MRNFFADLESDFLADGRDWILGTPGPTMADIEAVWIPAWLMGMKDALPAEVIGEEIFPRVWAYVHRFLGVVAEAKKMMGKMERIDGGIAAKRILSAENAGSDADGFVVEENDPLGLKAGQQVSVWPLDSGFSHKDQGKLVGLGWHEIVIEKDVDGAAGRDIVRLHFPRTGFRVMPVEAGKARL